MLVSNLKKIFHNSNHKKIMLTGLYLSSIAIFLLLGIVSGLGGHETCFWTKMTLAALTAILFYGYLKSFNIQLYAIFLILIAEIDSALVILFLHSENFITIYPFLIIFAFFFFFKLRAAIWMAIAHLLYWILVSAYGQAAFPDDPIFQVISPKNIFVSSIIASTFAYLYHISTEKTYEELKLANRQKEILLKEIHHRIKNNLNKISSMIGLQILSIENGDTEDTKEVLKKNKLRIEAMGMVHDTLYKADNLEEINFKKYITNLTQLINQMYDQNISVEIYPDDIDLPLEIMLKIGLIINELQTNTIKHNPIEENDRLRIVISLDKEQSNYTLRYHQQNRQPIDMETLKKTNTLGMKLIRLTVKEMNGEMDISDKDGLEFVIYFSY